MKKLLLALVIILTLALSGCEETITDVERWEQEDEQEFIDGLRYCYDVQFDDEECDVYDVRFYTQEEVDAMLQEIYDAFEDIESNDGYIENTYVNHNELNEMFDFAEQDWTVQDFVDYIDDLEDRVWELELTIEELEYFYGGDFTEDIEAFEDYVWELEQRIDELESEE